MTMETPFLMMDALPLVLSRMGSLAPVSFVVEFVVMERRGAPKLAMMETNLRETVALPLVPSSLVGLVLYLELLALPYAETARSSERKVAMMETNSTPMGAASTVKLSLGGLALPLDPLASLFVETA